MAELRPQRSSRGAHAVRRAVVAALPSAWRPVNPTSWRCSSGQPPDPPCMKLQSNLTQSPWTGTWRSRTCRCTFGPPRRPPATDRRHGNQATAGQSMGKALGTRSSNAVVHGVGTKTRCASKPLRHTSRQTRRRRAGRDDRHGGAGTASRSAHPLLAAQAEQRVQEPTVDMSGVTAGTVVQS